MQEELHPFDLELFHSDLELFHSLCPPFQGLNLLISPDNHRHHLLFSQGLAGIPEQQGHR